MHHKKFQFNKSDQIKFPVHLKKKFSSVLTAQATFRMPGATPRYQQVCKVLFVFSIKHSFCISLRDKGAFGFSR